MLVEIVGGIMSGSLALLADAAHMLTDTAALSLAWFAYYISSKPPDSRRSYGYHRFQVLAALLNGITLLAIVGWITVEAIRRLQEPIAIMGQTMLIVAVFGLIVNIISYVILHGGDMRNLNMRGAALHVLGDMLGSAGAIVAAVVILLTGFTPIDPILSIFIAALILGSAWDLVKKAAHILLEGSPEWLNIDLLQSELIKNVPEVNNIHHIHAWSLTPEKTMITMHADLRCEADHIKALVEMKLCLKDKFGITHSTIQIEQESCSDKDD